MKNKDKQNTPLIIVTFVIVFMVMWGLSFYFERKSYNLEQQLESCQEKVPVWTLKVECEDVWDKKRIYYEEDFNDYQEYQDALESLFPIGCEIIE